MQHCIGSRLQCCIAVFVGKISGLVKDCVLCVCTEER